MSFWSVWSSLKYLWDLCFWYSGISSLAKLVFQEAFTDRSLMVDGQWLFPPPIFVEFPYQPPSLTRFTQMDSRTLQSKSDSHLRLLLLLLRVPQRAGRLASDIEVSLSQYSDSWHVNMTRYITVAVTTRQIVTQYLTVFSSRSLQSQPIKNK